MGVLGMTRRKMESIELNLYKLGQLHGEKKKIKDPRRTKLINQVNLSADQMKEVDDFFLKNYGKKIPYDWHRLYTSFTGVFHKDYFPEFLYTSNLEPSWDPIEYQKVFADKNMLNILAKDIPGMRTAICYGSNVGGERLGRT